MGGLLSWLPKLGHKLISQALVQGQFFSFGLSDCVSELYGVVECHFGALGAMAAHLLVVASLNFINDLFGFFFALRMLEQSPFIPHYTVQKQTSNNYTHSHLALFVFG